VDVLDDRQGIRRLPSVKFPSLPNGCSAGRAADADNPFDNQTRWHTVDRVECMDSVDGPTRHNRKPRTWWTFVARFIIPSVEGSIPSRPTRLACSGACSVVAGLESGFVDNPRDNQSGGQSGGPRDGGVLFIPRISAAGRRNATRYLMLGCVSSRMTARRAEPGVLVDVVAGGRSPRRSVSGIRAHAFRASTQKPALS